MDAIELLSRYGDGERDFKGLSLRGMILSTHSYRPNTAITMGLANLREPQNRPHLIGADLSHADLSEAHLCLVNLSKANLTGAGIDGVINWHVSM